MAPSSSPPRRKRVGLRELKNGLSHGGAVVTVLHALARQVSWLEPPAKEFRALMKRNTDLENQVFDVVFGTDSFGRAPLAALGPGRQGYDFGGWATCPVNETFFREMLKAAPIDLSRVTFIDVGAGKGKALMLATEYPFQRIIGVEIVEALVKVARQNLNRYLARRRRVVPVELYCQDFMQWPLPREPSLFFFNDPFPFHLAERALSHVETSVRAHPRRALVLYRKAELAVIDRLDASPVFTALCRSPFWHLYTSRP